MEAQRDGEQCIHKLTADPANRPRRRPRARARRADRIEDEDDRLPSNVRIRRSATDNIGMHWTASIPRMRLCCTASVHHDERMKTLTITEGRGRLGYWLKKATQGEDVGFLFEGKVVALRPVEVVSTDYALQEYGVTPKEMEATEKRIRSELKAARARGEVTPFTEDSNDFHDGSISLS